MPGENEMPLPCEQEENISELKSMLQELTREFRGLLGEMRQAFIEDREHKIKIEALERGQVVIFDKLRTASIERATCISEKIDPVIEWKNKMDGSLSALKVIPIACVVITTLIAIYTFTKPDVNYYTTKHIAENNVGHKVEVKADARH